MASVAQILQGRQQPGMGGGIRQPIQPAQIPQNGGMGAVQQPMGALGAVAQPSPAAQPNGGMGAVAQPMPMPQPNAGNMGMSAPPTSLQGFLQGGGNLQQMGGNAAPGGGQHQMGGAPQQGGNMGFAGNIGSMMPMTGGPPPQQMAGGMGMMPMGPQNTQMPLQGGPAPFQMQQAQPQMGIQNTGDLQSIRGILNQ